MSSPEVRERAEKDATRAEAALCQFDWLCVLTRSGAERVITPATMQSKPFACSGSFMDRWLRHRVPLAP